MYKAKQRLKTLLLACFAALVSMLLAVALWVTPTNKIGASAEEGTYSYTFSTKQYTANATKTLGDVSWTLAGNGGYWGYDSTKGQQFGSSNSPYTTLTLTSETSFSNVSEIVINTSGASSINATLTVKVDETQIGDSITLTKTATEYTFTPDSSLTGAVVFGYTQTSSKAIYIKSITIYTESTSTTPSCTHEGYETPWRYDSEAKEHYQQCSNCTMEIDGTRTACSEFTYGEYSTADGVHTRTATCTVCGGEQEDSGACEVSAEYVREGDQHTQTGTCSICNASSSVTEACTLSYKNVSNDDKTHNMTSTCSVCQQSVTTENVNCTFDDGVLDGTTITYTCEYCEYSYAEEATMHTVTYVVPGITASDAVKVPDGYTTVLPKVDPIEGYTFVGWVEAKITEITETEPESFKAYEEYTVTADVTLYALYSYTEGTGAWTLVTDAANLAVGKQIVIVASDSDYALGTTQNSNNRAAVAVTKDGDTVTIGNSVQTITLEEGTIDSTFAFNVGNAYLYAASSSSNQLKTKTELDDNGSWLITIDTEGVATIKAQGTNTRNWLRKNSSSALFSCYSSGQNDVSIYMKDGATYYVTEFNTCAHENTNEVIEKATCTESGSKTVTCLDCESVIEAEILPALGHNYIDDICENCGLQDPASIVYDGYYYLSINDQYAWEKDGSYYKLDNAFTPNETINMDYVFYFIKNGETYDMYHMTNGIVANGVTIETQENYSVHILNSDGKILSHNTQYTSYIRMGFYATSNSYPCDIVLTEVNLSAHIDSASITIGEDITMNYYVTMSDEFATAKMQFTVENVTEPIIAEGTLAEDGRYVFSLNIPPQYMANNISAELIFNDMTIASKAEYSVKTYAQSMLNNIADGTQTDENGTLKQLLTDLLYYGDAAYNYANKTTGETPATSDVTNIGTASTATPETTDFTLENNSEISEYPAYFTGATVWFDGVNKIRVKINTIENVKLTINGNEVAVTGTTIETDGILATGFAETYTFVLSCDGVVMQTLTYSVNTYVFRTNNSETASVGMKSLALALYRYGESAKAYNA